MIVIDYFIVIKFFVFFSDQCILEMKASISKSNFWE